MKKQRHKPKEAEVRRYFSGKQYFKKFVEISPRLWRLRGGFEGHCGGKKHVKSRVVEMWRLIFIKKFLKGVCIYIWDRIGKNLHISTKVSGTHVFTRFLAWIDTSTETSTISTRSTLTFPV